MTENELYALKFSIGEFDFNSEPQDALRIKIWIMSIALFPERITQLTNDLSSKQKN